MILAKGTIIVLVGWILGFAGRPAFAQGPAGFRSAVTDRFEVFAPTEPDLLPARDILGATSELMRRWLGDYPPKIAVVLFDDPQDMVRLDFSAFLSRGILCLPCPTLSLMASMMAPAAGSNETQTGPELAAGVLAHEAAHVFFVQYVQSRFPAASPFVSMPGPQGISYGAENVADWFEETLAVLAEPPRMQSARCRWLSRNSGRLVALSLLFSRSAQTNKGSALFSSGGSVSDDELAYYAECLTLGQFLIEKEGPRVIGELAQALAQGKTMDLFLAARAGKGYSDVGGLEATWRAWLKTVIGLAP